MAEAGQIATTQQSQQQPQPPPPPQKCPRCDSLNTKFCYYNNYSLSQPRYFCKTCRRYWTQGGTLRNVPVGGGCRKGKRPKTSSSSSTISGDNISSRSLQPNHHLPPLPLTANQQQLQLQLPPHMITSMAAMVSTISGLPTTSHHQSLMRNSTPWGGGGGAHAPATSLYSTAGNLFSSLASMHSLTPSQGGTNHPTNLGTGGSGSSLGSGANLPIFQGFDFPLSMKTQQVQNHHSTFQMHQSSGFQGMVHEQDKDGGEPPFYSTADQNLVRGQPGAAARTLNSWNNHGGVGGEGDNNINDPNPTFWNNSSGSTSSSMAGSSANAKQWPNLPGFGGAS